MSAKLHLASPSDLIVEPILSEIQARSQMDIAFIARTLPGGEAAQITTVTGGEAGTIENLVVRRGAGLGGKALALLRPVSVSSYRTAAGITHEYDAQVLPERIEMLSAFPVTAGSISQYVVYLGRRTPTRVGDRWFDSVTPLIRRLSDALRPARPEQLDSGLGAQKPGLSKAQLDATLAELSELSRIVGNGPVRTRLVRLLTQLEASEQPTPQRDVSLTPREVEVLRLVSTGRSNRQAGAELGLTENTVKSYLKSAMGKLEVNNRVQAISAARELGLIV